MSQERLAGLITISTERELAQEIKLNGLIADFANLKFTECIIK